MQAKARAAAGAARRAAAPAHARRDTARAGAAPPPPAGRRAPPVAGAPRAPSGRDSGAVRVDTTRVRQLLKQRPVPFDRLVVQTVQPPAPGGKNLGRGRGATKLNRATADAQGALTLPV